jgi:HTH-type transcriptional regulator/antitoxin MqsA
MTGDTCPNCGHKKLVREIRPMTIEYKGLSATFDMPGLYCESCGEGILSGRDAAVYDHNLNRLKAQAERLLDPEQIRKIRQALRLSQVEAGSIIGGGKNAFQLYESGTRLPSQAVSNILRLLEANPSGIEILRQNAGNDNAR